MKDDRSNKRRIPAIHFAACLTLLLAAGHAKAGVITYGVFGASTAEAATVVTDQGYTAHVLSDLSQTSLAAIDVLWVLNSSNSSHPANLTNFATEVGSFVNQGGVFMYHDRFVTDAGSVLPGGAGFDFARSLGTDIDVLDGNTLVTNGPGGIVDNTTLDGGNSSFHGFTVSGTLPNSATLILGTSNSTEIVDLRYDFGIGHVYYSTIPLDFNLLGAGSNQNFKNIYAPNVVAYTAELAQSTTAPELVPEPSSIALMTLGGAFMALGAYRRRRREDSNARVEA